MAKKIEVGGNTGGDQIDNPPSPSINKTNPNSNGSHDDCDDTCVVNDKHFRHVRTSVVVLFGIALVLLIWSYLNYLCATNLGSDNNTTNWLLQLFYGDRCRRVGTDIGLPKATGDNDKQQLSLDGTSLSIEGGNTIDLTTLIGSPGAQGPAGANGLSGVNGSNGAPGPTGPPGPVITGDALAGPGVSFTGSGVGRLVGGNLTINNTGVLSTTASGPLASTGGQNPDISLIPCAAAETYVYNGANWVCTSAPLPYTFQNGLTESPAGTVELGGVNPFLHDTNLDQNGFDFIIDGGIGGNFDQSMTNSVSGNIHGMTSGENIFGAPINGSVIYSSPNPAMLPFGGEGSYNYAIEGQSGLGASDGIVETSNFVFFPIGYTMNHNGVAGSSSINAGSNNLGFIAQDSATGFLTLANFNNIPGVAEIYAQGVGSNFSQVYADGVNSLMRIYTQTNPGAIASLDLNAGTNISQWYTQDNLGGTTQSLHDTVAGRINNSVSSGLNFNNFEQNSATGLIFNSNIAPVFAPNMFSVSNNGDVTFDRELRAGGNAGNAGEVLISQGLGLPPIWGVGGFLSSADNGLTVNPANNVQLGGTLLQDTTITGNAYTYYMEISGLSSAFLEADRDFFIQSNDRVLVRAGQNSVQVSSSQGISLNFDPTDSLFIDGSAGLGGQVLTSQGGGLPPIWANTISSADNGLSINPVGNVQLGGALIQDTTITNNGFDITFAGSSQSTTIADDGTLLVNTAVPVVGKVAVFNGDIDVTGIIDPYAVQFSGPGVSGGYQLGVVAGATQRAIYVSPDTNATDVFQVRRADDTTVVLDVDTVNNRLGLNTATPTTGLELAGQITNSEVVRFNDGVDTVGQFIVNGDPNGTIAGSRGSIAQDYTNGRLYINTDDAMAWSGVSTGGTLDDAYNFGGPAAGREINVLGAGNPVQINTSVATGGPIDYTLGFSVNGDGGLNNPLSSGVGFAKVIGDFGGGVTDASATVYSGDMNNFPAGNFGFNAFLDYPGNELYVNGLNSGFGQAYGQLVFGTMGSSLSTGDSQTPVGSGLGLNFGTGNGGSTSGDGGGLFMSTGSASDGNGGSFNIFTGAGNGATGVGGNINVGTNNGSLNGGNISFNTGSGITGNGGDLNFGAGTGDANGGNISFGAGPANNNNGGSFNMNAGNSNNGNGGNFGLNAGNGPLGGGGVGINAGNDFSFTNSGGGFSVNAGVGAFGGGVSLSAGNATTNAGSVNINAGNGLISGVSSGGGVTIAAGSAFQGGSINLFAGDGDLSGTDNGGAISLNGGDGSNVAGPIFINGGNSSTGGGGGIFLQAGASNNTTGSDVFINSGSGTVGSGGNMSFNTGNGDFSGGTLSINTGSGGNGAGGNINVTTGFGTNSNGGGITYFTGGGDINGGDVVYSLGGGTLGNGGAFSIATGPSVNAVGGGFAVTTGAGLISGGDISLSTGGGGINGSVIFSTGGTERGRFDSVGNLGVGTPTPANRLDVVDTSDDSVASFTGASGTCTVDTLGGTLSCVSDEKLKENILSMSGSLEKILALRGVTYNWKSDELKQEVAGFVAQEVEDVIPELVKELENGTKTLDKTGMIPYLVEALKTQNGQIEETNKSLVTQGITLNKISGELESLVSRVEENEAADKTRDIKLDQVLKENELLKQRLDELENK